MFIDIGLLKAVFNKELLDSPIEAQVNANKKGRYFLMHKRIVDIFLSILFLVAIMSWLTPLIAILIMLDSKGPIFFFQKRVGKNNRIFTCFKFRTMRPNEEADCRQASENDERITQVGKFLRKTNIDEFPQFLNVLLGNMSIVGPRPHMVSDNLHFSTQILNYEFRLLLRPGITGMAQVKGFHGPTSDYERIYRRYQWDAFYIRNACLWLDFRIIYKSAALPLSQLIPNFITRRSKM